MRWFRLWSGTKRAPAKKAAAARAADLASLNRDIKEAGVTSLRAIARELNAREEIDANDPKRPLPAVRSRACIRLRYRLARLYHTGRAFEACASEAWSAIRRGDGGGAGSSGPI